MIKIIINLDCILKVEVMLKMRIFQQGEFSDYSNVSLNESRAVISEISHYTFSKTTVFISHKHDELDDLKGVIGFLQKEYDVKVYIDSQDSFMPKVTSAKTAIRIKDRITKCDKFILLATNGAIDSKWCNWELGFGDAKKYKKNIALFPMKPEELDNNYHGNEYMRIYPYIVYFNGTEKYSNGNTISKGYYVREETEDGNYITPLDVWFSNK